MTKKSVQTISPVAYFRSPFTEKFGIPRQSGLVSDLHGRIVFVEEWRNEEALRGIEDFDYLWLIWEFTAHRDARKSPTVRPPLLGGNRRMGVFATRSPFRPNNLGLSCVRLERVEWETPEGPVVHVLGADLMDGTPIYDVKPYLPYADAHPDARGGFTQEQPWRELKVSIPPEREAAFTEEQLRTLIRTLQLDPRPHYQDDAERIYGMMFDGHNIHFRVNGDQLEII